MMMEASLSLFPTFSQQGADLTELSLILTFYLKEAVFRLQAAGVQPGQPEGRVGQRDEEHGRAPGKV